MSNATPSRRVLSDLNVNTIGIPSAVRLMEKGTLNVKRGINDVGDPESSPAPLRVRSELHPLPKPSRLQGFAQTNKQEVGLYLLETMDCHLTYSQDFSPETTIKMSLAVADQEEELPEGDSQHSNKDSTASFLDSDIEDDTMASQQTMATEMTMDMQSAAALVLLPEAGLVTQTDIGISALKTFAFDYASPCTKSRPIKLAYQCRGSRSPPLEAQLRILLLGFYRELCPQYPRHRKRSPYNQSCFQHLS